MKLAFRIFALSLVVAGTVVGNTLPKTPGKDIVVHSSSVPGPVPVCDPWGKEVCSIRK
jgi:hypothetical protein